MILTDIRRVLLAASGPTSLGEIAGELDSHPEAVRAMLEVWIGKGRVVRLPAINGCGTQCRGCDASQTEYYAWADKAGPNNIPPTCPSV